MPHDRLINKLKAIGVQGKILDWIREWLCNWEQRVGINGVFTGWQKVVSGVQFVPQGSIF